MKRLYEWEVYRKYIKEGSLEKESWQEHLEKSQKERMEALSNSMDSRTPSRSDTSSRSSTQPNRKKSKVQQLSCAKEWSSLSDETEAASEANFVSARERREEKRKTRSKRMNVIFQMQSAVDDKTSKEPGESPEGNPWYGKFQNKPPKTDRASRETEYDDWMAEYEKWLIEHEKKKKKEGPNK